MAAIKQLEQSATRWSRRAAAAAGDYQAGVQQPRRDWATAASEANAIYQAAVTQAASQGRYAAGVKKVGSQKWQQAAMQKGPGRFAEGVGIATDEWQRGFSPYHQALSALSLPARGPKGSPQNIQRVAAVATALNQLRARAGK